jgi:hypothetical protein
MSQGETPVKTVGYSVLLAVWSAVLAQVGQIRQGLSQSPSALTAEQFGIVSGVKFTADRL